MAQVPLWLAGWRRPHACPPIADRDELGLRPLHQVLDSMMLLLRFALAGGPPATKNTAGTFCPGFFVYTLNQFFSPLYKNQFFSPPLQGGVGGVEQTKRVL